MKLNAYTFSTFNSNVIIRETIGTDDFWVTEVRIGVPSLLTPTAARKALVAELEQLITALRDE